MIYPTICTLSPATVAEAVVAVPPKESRQKPVCGAGALAGPTRLNQ